MEEQVRVEIVQSSAAMRESLGAIKEELDEHLDAINQNTNEVLLTYEYLSELDAKIDKLMERMDRIEAMLERH